MELVWRLGDPPHGRLERLHQDAQGQGDIAGLGLGLGSRLKLKLMVPLRSGGRLLRPEHEANPDLPKPT